MKYLQIYVSTILFFVFLPISVGAITAATLRFIVGCLAWTVNWYPTVDFYQPLITAGLFFGTIGGIFLIMILSDQVGLPPNFFARNPNLKKRI